MENSIDAALSELPASRLRCLTTMISLTFADDSGALDLVFAAFTSQLDKLVRAESAGLGGIDHYGRVARQERPRLRARGIHSAGQLRKSRSALRAEQRAHDATGEFTRHRRGKGERVEVHREPARWSAHDVASVRSNTALEAAVDWIRSRLAQLAQAAGFELSGGVGSDQ